MPKGDKLTKKYYVYALIDPRDGKPFYIGKGCGNRVSHHVQAARRMSENDNRNVAKIERIWDIHKAGLVVGERILRTGLSAPKALRIERYLIRWFGASITNNRQGDTSEYERAYQRIRFLISKAKTPMQWAKDFARRTGRIPDRSDMAQYWEIWNRHIHLREHIKAKLNA